MLKWSSEKKKKKKKIIGQQPRMLKSWVQDTILKKGYSAQLFQNNNILIN